MSVFLLTIFIGLSGQGFMTIHEPMQSWGQCLVEREKPVEHSGYTVYRTCVHLAVN